MAPETIDNKLKGWKKYVAIAALSAVASMPLQSHSEQRLEKAQAIVIPESGFWLDGAACIGKDKILEGLYSNIEMTPVEYGLDKKGYTVYMLLATKDRRRFSVMSYKPDGTGCINAAGYGLLMPNPDEYKYPAEYVKQSVTPPSGMNCMRRKDVLDNLRGKYGEVIRWGGGITDASVDNPEPTAVLELYHNKVTETWTLLYNTIDGATSCTVANGKGLWKANVKGI